MRLALLLACLLLAACQPYAVAWRATAAVKSAGELTEDTLASVIRTKHQECLKANASKSPGFTKCISEYHKAAIYWLNYVKPGVNSALRATVASLTIAEKVKGKEAYDWPDLLKPAVCALLAIAKEWAPILPSAVQKQLGALLNSVKGVTCGSK